MRHKTVGEYEEAVRKFCRKCQNSKRLVENHCTATDCDWYDDRQSLIIQTRPMIMFSAEGFYQNAISILKEDYDNMLSCLWWSDIRLHIEKRFDDLRYKKPSKNQLNWYGCLSRKIVDVGWSQAFTTRISPLNGAREHMYVKIPKINLKKDDNAWIK